MIYELSLPEVDNLYAYWSDHPPVHLLVAAYLGYKKSGATAACVRQVDPEKRDWTWEQWEKWYDEQTGPDMTAFVVSAFGNHIFVKGK